MKAVLLSVSLLLGASLAASAAEYPYSPSTACRDGSASIAMQRPGGFCSLTSVGVPRKDPGSHAQNTAFMDGGVLYIRFESGKVRPADSSW